MVSTNHIYTGVGAGELCVALNVRSNILYCSYVTKRCESE